MYVCMYVCMHVYVCMYVCMYGHIIIWFLILTDVCCMMKKVNMQEGKQVIPKTVELIKNLRSTLLWDYTDTSTAILASHSPILQ